MHACLEPTAWVRVLVCVMHMALSLTLVFGAASCLYVVLLYVWLRANRCWFRFSFAAGSSVASLFLASWRLRILILP